jgi:hypothetical protein
MNKIKSFRYNGVVVTIYACDGLFHVCLEFSNNDAVFASDFTTYVDAVQDACTSVLELTLDY